MTDFAAPPVALMIAPDQDFDGAPVLFRRIALEGGHGAVVSAALEATALGVVTPLVGGRPVTDEVLTPGWSSYEWRLRYRRWEVAPEAVADGAELALALGNGWYRGQLTWLSLARVYGPELAGWARLELVYADGHRQVITTDQTWQARPSDTTFNDLYDGQTIDARRRGAALPTVGVHAIDFDPAKLVPFETPPVRPLQEIPPQKVFRAPSGKVLVDFGQNLVGWVRVKVSGPVGTTVTLRHAEVLEHGELGTRPLRRAKATDNFVLSGGQDVFEPRLTYHGFRYVEVAGWPGGPDAIGDGSLTAVVVGSDVPPTGTFECSEPLLNQLHHNAVWSMRGNFLAVPTDCPQRDERLGWTGDLAIFAPTAAFLGDVSGFLGDWLVDLDLEQAHAAGLVPFVVPDVLKYIAGDPTMPPVDTVAVWSDAAVWVPWTLWQAYGDRAALERQYPAAAAHLRRLAGLLESDGVWSQGFQFGDWLDPDAPPDNPAAAKTPPVVVATAVAYRTACLMAQMADLLGLAEDAAEWRALAGRIREGFRDRFVRSDASGCWVESDAPTAYAIAIAWELLTPAETAAAGVRLAELAAAAGYRISAGFVGTAFILDALAQTGQLDAAYRLLLQRECPSWLYAVTMGATTIWERWDSMLPDGSINPGEMTSFNHYAYGAVADWLHRVVGGLAPAEPGYRVIRFAPRPGGGLTWAKVELATRFGVARCAWQAADGHLAVTVTVPDGATGVVDLPGLAPVEVAPGEHRFTA